MKFVTSQNLIKWLKILMTILQPFQLVPGITMDFDLSDPFFTEYKPGEYKPLHDPHLKHFLNKKSVRRCLMKNNLITKDGEVRCTLQEFNRFQVII